jgi:hypothetical protein
MLIEYAPDDTKKMCKLFFVFLEAFQSESASLVCQAEKIKNKDTESVVSALIKHSKKLHVFHRPIEAAAVCRL